jgi:hypothetical protein
VKRSFARPFDPERPEAPSAGRIPWPFPERVPSDALEAFLNTAEKLRRETWTPEARAGARETAGQVLAHLASRPLEGAPFVFTDPDVEADTLAFERACQPSPHALRRAERALAALDRHIETLGHGPVVGRRVPLPPEKRGELQTVRDTLLALVRAAGEPEAIESFEEAARKSTLALLEAFGLEGRGRKAAARLVAAVAWDRGKRGAGEIPDDRAGFIEGYAESLADMTRPNRGDPGPL